jgi:hypothetical protein
MSLPDVGRNDPCPCGSGAKYKHCCLRKEKEQRDRRAQEEEARAREAESEHDPETCPNCRRAALIGDAIQSDADWNQLEEAVDHYFWCQYGLIDLHNRRLDRPGKSGMQTLMSRLNMPTPALQAADRPAKLMLSTYVMFGHPELTGARSWIFEAARDRGRDDLLETYNELKEARPIAFEFEVDPMTRIRPLTGRTDEEAFDVLDVISDEGDFVQEPGVYVGWLHEWRGIPLVMFANPVPTRAAERLAEAAEESFWGETEEDFRRRDYEADLLTVCIDPECEEETGVEERRFGFEQDERATLEPSWLGFELMEALQEEGLPLAERYVPWHLALAGAEEGETLESVISEIDWQIQRAYSAEFLFGFGEPEQEEQEERDGPPIEEVLAWLGLDPDGRMELPATAEPPRGEERRRLRWATLMTRWLEPAWPAGDAVVGLPGRPTLGDWLAGLEYFFGDTLYRTPIEQLPEASGSYRNRLTKGLKRDRTVDEPLLVWDIPISTDRLTDRKGIGQKTAERTVEALRLLVESWLDEQTVEADEIDEAAAQQIGEGLDELEDLF